MPGYSAHDVAKMLDLSVEQVRSYARDGLVGAARGPRGSYRFSFQDLVILRTAKGLHAASIAPGKVRSALKKLREQLPSGRTLTGVQIAAAGDEVVVRDGKTLWNPESGQTRFNFEVAELAQKVAPMVREAAQRARESETELSGQEWYELGCDLDMAADQAQARDAYRRCLELSPGHADAHLNLGRLLHEAGQPAAAEAHYRLALTVRPDDATAFFNIGVSLEDLKREDEAILAYQNAVVADPACADAYFNLARLFEEKGDAASALQNFSAYRRLTK